MRFIALLLCFICLPVFANTKSEFHKLIDEFNYSVTVDWDQKDSQFLNNATEKFKVDLAKLQTDGLTKADVLEALKERHLSPSTLESMILAHGAEVLNSNEAIMNFIKNNFHNLNRRGASWNGEVTFFVIWGVGLLAVITAIVLVLADTSGEYVCTEYGTTEKCEESQWCMTYDPNDSNSCISWSSPTMYCSYPCINGYWKD